MSVFTTIKKHIVSNVNGVIMADYNGSNSISFFADLPKSAVIDRIKVDGVFLEDVNTKKIRLHREFFEANPFGNKPWRVAATVWFEEDNLELYDKLANHVVQDFEVYYHNEAIAEMD